VIVGVIGLGNMGNALAANLVGAGFEVVGHDAAGAERAPEGVRFFDDAHEVGRRARIVVLSLPDGNVSETVARALLETEGLVTTHVIDTSTTGVHAARAIAALLGEQGVAYVDAPVSGGRSGAEARTMMVMYAAAEAACAAVEPVLAGLSNRRCRVGSEAGMAQAMKLANNFLSATALAATSEAIAFGESVGLDMATMLEVLGASSGQNTATNDKFPNHVLTGRFASGFSNSLMAKDMHLYLKSVEELGGPAAIGAVTEGLWAEFAALEPDVDFTRIFPFVERGRGGKQSRPALRSGEIERTSAEGMDRR